MRRAHAGSMSETHGGESGESLAQRTSGKTSKVDASIDTSNTGAEQPTAVKPPAKLVKLTSPLALRLAGRRWFPLWAVVRHRGRKSGKDYSIPVAVIVTPNSFIIGLPWGPKTNWAQNVLAAGGCAIRWKAQDYQVTNPRLVGSDRAVAAANRLEGKILRRTGMKDFLEVQR